MCITPLIFSHHFQNISSDVNLVQPRRLRGVETVLENGPPIGWHTFSSDLICQRMPPVSTFPPMVGARDFKDTSLGVGIWLVKLHKKKVENRNRLTKTK